MSPPFVHLFLALENLRFSSLLFSLSALCLSFLQFFPGFALALFFMLMLLLVACSSSTFFGSFLDQSPVHNLECFLSNITLTHAHCLTATLLWYQNLLGCRGNISFQKNKIHETLIYRTFKLSLVDTLIASSCSSLLDTPKSTRPNWLLIVSLNKYVNQPNNSS